MPLTHTFKSLKDNTRRKKDNSSLKGATPLDMEEFVGVEGVEEGQPANFMEDPLTTGWSTKRRCTRKTPPKSPRCSTRSTPCGAASTSWPCFRAEQDTHANLANAPLNLFLNKRPSHLQP